MEDRGKNIVNTKWVVTEKIKEGKKVCKVRVFEEDETEMETEVQTSSHEKMRNDLARVKVEVLDIKPAYPSGEEIEVTKGGQKE